MNTRVIQQNDEQALPSATQVLAEGGLVVFPTDTLYGLAASPWNLEALRRIYAVKGRSAAKAIPVLVAGPSQLEGLIAFLPAGAKALMQAYWPGALTLVLPAYPGLPEELSPYPTLAVRCPRHPFALRLLERSGPLAVSSANLSDAENPHNATGVLGQLDGLFELLIDGGDLPHAQASTVLDCSGELPKILRPGPLSLEDLLQVWRKA